MKIKGVKGPVIPFIPFWEDFESKYFGVLFHVSPAEEARPLNFNPQRIHLVLNENNMLTPSQMKGLFPFPCKLSPEDEQRVRAVEEISISDHTCVVLFFDQEVPRLGQPFSILVEGLTVSGRDLAGLRVNFARTNSQWHAGVGEFNFRVK